jgi:hypothetical protein
MMQSNGPHCDEGPGALGCSPATQLEPAPECSSPPCCTQRVHAQHTGRDPPGRRLRGPSARAFAPENKPTHFLTCMPCVQSVTESLLHFHAAKRA